MTLSVLTPTFAVCQMPAESSIPGWAQSGSFFSISKASDELSIVCEQSLLPEGSKAEKNWKVIKVHGPMEFSLVGVLASISKPLAESKISIFAISTFNTDYIMVKEPDLQNAIVALTKAGFIFQSSES